MESTKEPVIGKVKRRKSPTRYPKIMPTYIVAFAVQETLDDPQKLDQITNKRSTDSTNSIKPISPTDSTSTKTFTISLTEKLSSALNIASLSEVKINIVDENQCGDVTEKKSTQFRNYTEINEGTIDKKSEIKLNAPKHIKKCKENNKFSKKVPKKSKRAIKFTNIHVKYKKTKMCISRQLEKYYEKAKLNSPNGEQIQKQIYCNDLLKYVQRSRVLKKKLAKENLLADCEQILSQDGGSFDYDNESLNSSSPSTKKSFLSHTSQKTLVYKESFTSRNEEEYVSVKPANSVIEVISDNQIPYKSKIFDDSLVVNDSKTYAVQTSSAEKLMHEENLTSTETFSRMNTTELTSKPSSSEEPKFYKIDYSDLSPKNLIEKLKNNDTCTQAVKPAVERDCEDDTFVNTRRTSSDFNKSSLNSNFTFQMNSETTVDSEILQSNLPTNYNLSNVISNNTTLSDRVKNLGFYPIKTPISDANIDCESKDELIAVNINNSLFSKDPKTISDDHSPLSDVKKTIVLRKPVEVKNMSYFQNSICLSEEVAIKAKLKEKAEEKQSCTDKGGYQYPKDMGEMYKQVTLIIDLAMKRLEETLSYRIVKEIRESLALFTQPQYKVPMAEFARAATTAAPVNIERPIPTMYADKEIFVQEDHLKFDVDVCVQCDLVHKQVIDQLMYQLSLVPKPIPDSEDAMKLLNPTELLKDYTEVLKPPAAHITDSVSVEEGKGDGVTVSTATTELSTVRSFRRLKRLITCPLGVIRENLVIVTSVPTFFIVLFCLYGVIVVVMKPW